MWKTMHISLILVLSALCISKVFSAVKEGWLNPLDIHSYDHVNKVMRTTTEVPKVYESTGDCSTNQENLQQCMASLQKFQASKESQEFTYEFIIGKLQRQTAFILQAADLLEEGTEGSDAFYIQRYLLLSLSRDQLTSLRKFATSGKLDAESVDAAWREMLYQVEDPSKSKWHWITKWLPPNIFADSRENVILFMEVCVVILPAVLLILKMPIHRVFLVFVLLAFSFSVVIRYHRVTEANKMRQQHMLKDIKDMPSSCRPNNRSWWEVLQHLGKSDEYDARVCAQYYESTYTDPLIQTTPLEQVFQILIDIFVIMSERSGSALNTFTQAVFVDLPYPLNVIVGAVTKILVFIMVVVAIIGFSIPGASNLVYRATRGILFTPRDQIPERERASSQSFSITNHGTLVLGNANSGIEVLPSSSSGHTTLFRAQSESGIKYSSQSTSTTGLNIDQSERSNRPRSYSDGTIATAKCSNCNTSTPNLLTNSPSSRMESISTAFSSLFVSNNENIPSLSAVEEESENNCQVLNEHLGQISTDSPSKDDDTSIEKYDTESSKNLEEKLLETKGLFSTPMKEVQTVSCSPDTSLSPSRSELSVFLNTLNIDDSINEMLQSPVPTTPNVDSNQIQAELSSYEIVDSDKLN